MLIRAISAAMRRDWVRAIPGAILGSTLIMVGMGLMAVLLASANASPLIPGQIDTDWPKILTLLAGLVGVYVAIDRRITRLEEAASAQAAMLQKWAGEQLADLRVQFARVEAVQDTHGKRLDRAEASR